MHRRLHEAIIYVSRPIQEHKNEKNEYTSIKILDHQYHFIHTTRPRIEPAPQIEPAPKP